MLIEMMEMDCNLRKPDHAGFEREKLLEHKVDFHRRVIIMCVRT